MKRFCLFLFLLASFGSYAQKTYVSRITSGHGDSTDVATSIAVDPAGNTYTGGYSGSLTLQIGDTTLQNTNWVGQYANLFLYKADPAGKVLWALGSNGDGSEYITHVVYDPYAGGSIYVCGYYQSRFMDFGPYRVDNLYHNGKTNSDVFIARCNLQGQVQWMKRISGKYNERTGQLAADGQGHVYLCGWSNSKQLVQGNDTLPDSTASSKFFLTKMNSNGSFAWTKQYPIPAIVGTPVLSYDAAGSGSLLLSSNFIGSVSIGTDTLKAVTPYDEDVFVARIDTAGNRVWLQGIAGSRDDRVAGVLVSGNHYYVSGAMESDTMFLGSTMLKRRGRFSDIFLAKYTSSGSVVWAKSYGADTPAYAYQAVYAMAGNGNGDIFLGGGYEGYGLVAGQDTLRIDSGFSMLLLKARPDGSLAWGKVLGGDYRNANSGMTELAVDAHGNLHFSGVFYSRAFYWGKDSLLNTYQGKREIGDFISGKYCLNLPDVHISSSGPACKGRPVTLAAAPGLRYRWNTGDTTATVSLLPDTNRTYSVVLTTPGGCTDTAYQQLNVYPLPVPVTIAGDTLVTRTDSRLYVTATSDSSTRQWIFDKGTGSSTGDSITITWNQTGTTQLKLVEMSNKGCTGDTARLNITIMPLTSVAEALQQASPVQVYPNPSAGRLSFRNEETYRCTVEVYSPEGRIVDRFTMEAGGMYSADYSHLAAGVYQVRMSNGEAVNRQKLVIAR